MDLHFDYNYSKFLSELVYEVTHKLIRDIPELKDFGHNFPFSRKDLEVNGNSKQAFEMLVWNIYWNMYVFKGTQNFPHFLIYYQNVLFFSCLLNILHQIKNKEVLFENAIKYLYRNSTEKPIDADIVSLIKTNSQNCTEYCAIESYNNIIGYWNAALQNYKQKSSYYKRLKYLLEQLELIKECNIPAINTLVLEQERIYQNLLDQKTIK